MNPMTSSSQTVHGHLTSANCVDPPQTSMANSGVENFLTAPGLQDKPDRDALWPGIGKPTLKSLQARKHCPRYP